MSQDTRYSYSGNSVTIFNVKRRGIYRSQTIHSSSHNPGDSGILLTSRVSYRCVYLNGNEKYEDDISFDDGYGSRNGSRDDGESRGNMIVDDGRHGYRSKETSQFLSCNMVETGGDDGICGYRSQTRHYSYH